MEIGEASSHCYHLPSMSAVLNIPYLGTTLIRHVLQLVMKTVRLRMNSCSHLKKIKVFSQNVGMPRMVSRIKMRNNLWITILIHVKENVIFALFTLTCILLKYCPASKGITL